MLGVMLGVMILSNTSQFGSNFALAPLPCVDALGVALAVPCFPFLSATCHCSCFFSSGLFGLGFGTCAPIAPLLAISAGSSVMRFTGFALSFVPHHSLSTCLMTRFSSVNSTSSSLNSSGCSSSVSLSSYALEGLRVPLGRVSALCSEPENSDSESSSSRDLRRGSNLDADDLGRLGDALGTRFWDALCDGLLSGRRDGLVRPATDDALGGLGNGSLGFDDGALRGLLLFGEGLRLVRRIGFGTPRTGSTL